MEVQSCFSSKQESLKAEAEIGTGSYIKKMQIWQRVSRSCSTKIEFEMKNNQYVNNFTSLLYSNL